MTLILGTILVIGVGASHTTLAQNAGLPQGEKSVAMYLPDAQCHFDPATDTTFQMKKQKKARLLKQYPLASARLSHALLQVMDAHEKLGKETSLRLAKAAGGDFVEDRITVIVQLVDGSDPDDISKKIEAAGGVIVRARSDHIKASSTDLGATRDGRDDSRYPNHSPTREAGPLQHDHFAG